MDATEDINHPLYRGIIFRRTFPRLANVIDRCYQRYPGLGGKYDSTGHVWTFPSKAKIKLAHCQAEGDKYIYQGHEYQFMAFDQLEEFTETQYDFLKAQNRTSVPEIQARVRSTTNPGGIGHGWVKRRFISGLDPYVIYKYIIDGQALTKCFIPATIYDNPTLLKADPKYVARLKSLPLKLRKALLEGNWDVFEGQYFAEWDLLKHTCKPFKIPDTWKRYISLDYGFAKPAAIYWYAIDFRGKVYMYWELYKEQLTYLQLASLIKIISSKQKIEYLVADPAIWGDRAHHKDQEEGVSGAEVLEDGLPDIMILKADNSRNTGWIRARQHLMNEQFVVFDTCKNFIRTVPDLIYDEHKAEDLNDEGEDHAADSWRYFLMSRSEVPVKEKKDVKVQDAYAEALAEQESLMSTGFMGE